MKSFMRIELKRAFGNIFFLMAFVITMGICVWHFKENVWVLRNWVYGYKDSYPLSAFGKWIGGENSSLQPTLYYLIIPILCAIPYGKTYYFDLKSGYINQLIIRGEKKDYLVAKLMAAFLNGAVLSAVPLLFDFLLTGTVLPAIMPQSGSGLFSISPGSIMSELFYVHPYLYLLLYLLLNATFFGLLNTISFWAVDFVENSFWIILMPFIVYIFVFCISQFIGLEKFAAFLFLRPSQPYRSIWEIVVIELLVLVACNIIFFVFHKKREGKL